LHSRPSGRATSPESRPEGSRRANVSLVVDRAHYEIIVSRAIASARVAVWIATANVKQLMVEAPIGSVARARGRYVSILETFDGLVARGVHVRLLHAGPPSRPFREELARHRRLHRREAPEQVPRREGPRQVKEPRFEMRACPRVHLKMIAIDGAFLYLGSANFTGAGLGAKGDGRRNFEAGIVTDDEWLLDETQARFEQIWSGGECGTCRVRSMCARPLDALSSRGASG
jgi:phosphatidylserine/phosphatidylglycerophosphate/cardiolipin synthase-like enzyme